MGEVMVVKDRSINRVIDLMRKDGLDEERAINNNRNESEYVLSR